MGGAFSRLVLGSWREWLSLSWGHFFLQILGGEEMGLLINMVHSLVETLPSSLWKLNSKSVHYIVVIDIEICSGNATTNPFRKACDRGFCLLSITLEVPERYFAKETCPSSTMLGSCHFYTSSTCHSAGTRMALGDICWQTGSALILPLWCPLAHWTYGCLETGYEVTLMYVYTMDAPWHQHLWFSTSISLQTWPPYCFIFTMNGLFTLVQ